MIKRLLRKQIKFNDDGSANIIFFGIKNDSDRKGFEIVLGSTDESVIDPVLTLQDYIKRTRKLPEDEETPCV